MNVRSTVLEQAREILDRDDVTLDDDFFEVGGDSLLGMHFVGRVGRAVELPVRMTMLFEYPVLGEFATQVEGLRAQQIQRSAAVFEPTGSDAP